jgi:hypothetical protein
MCAPGFFIQSSSWEKVTNQTSFFWVAYSMKAMAASVLSCGIGAVSGRTLIKAEKRGNQGGLPPASECGSAD